MLPEHQVTDATGGAYLGGNAPGTSVSAKTDLTAMPR
jgi:hypothetical protein